MSTNKTIVITGTNKGIGFDLVKLLCSKGMEVIATCRDEKKCDALKTAVPHARVYILDLDDEQSISSFAEQITNDYSKIDILINNAGAMLDGEWVGNTVSHISPAILQQTFQSNFFGTVYLTQLLLPLIQKSDAGRIVNVSSIMGSLGMHSIPGNELWEVKPFAYNASKAALNHFTVHLAQIFYNSAHSAVSIHPGWVKTDLGGEMAPLAAADAAKELAAVALCADTRHNGKFIFNQNTLPW